MVKEHIIRLLQEKQAFAKGKSINRRWLDEQLINKIEGVDTQQQVSFGLIDLKKKGLIDYEGDPIHVWLKEPQGPP